MGRLLAKPRLRAALVGLGLLCAALALIAWPAQSAAAVREGMALCANVVVPSLFPFFVLASLVVELGLSRCLGRLLHPIMAPLFRVNGACAAALALGFVGGYPVGARTAIQLYQQGQCSKTEAERLLAFCNNSGPAFILGAVGAGVLGSGRAGLALYLCHMAASLMVGLLFRFYRPGEGPSSPRRMGERFQAVSFSAAFPRSVTGAMTSSLNICAFILCFSVVVRLLTLSGLLGAAAQLLSSLPPPLALPPAWSRRLLVGALELSSGVYSLTDGSLTGRLSMAAFMLGWAGVSVHLQVLAFLGDSGLSMRTYLTGKLLHGGLSALLMGALAPRLAPTLSVSACLIQQTEAIAGQDALRALALSAAAAWGLWLCFLALAVFPGKKAVEKPKRLRYNR